MTYRWEAVYSPADPCLFRSDLVGVGFPDAVVGTVERVRGPAGTGWRVSGIGPVARPPFGTEGEARAFVESVRGIDGWQVER